jgi:hypothetical protein
MFRSYAISDKGKLILIIYIVIYINLPLSEIAYDLSIYTVIYINLPLSEIAYDLSIYIDINNYVDAQVIRYFR